MMKVKVIAIGTPKEILASNILPRIGLREPIYIEALKRLHFDSNNDVIYPMENLQKGKQCYKRVDGETSHIKGILKQGIT